MNTKLHAWLGAAAITAASTALSMARAQEPAPPPPPPGEHGQHPDGPPHAPGMRPQGPPTFKAADTNNDGSISEEEFNAVIERGRGPRGEMRRGGPGGGDFERRPDGPRPPRGDHGFDGPPPPPPDGLERRAERGGDFEQGPPPGGFERRGGRGGDFPQGPPPREFRDGAPGGPGHRPGPPPPPHPPRFEEIDANGDGNISKQEFENVHVNRRGPRHE